MSFHHAQSVMRGATVVSVPKSALKTPAWPPLETQAQCLPLCVYDQVVVRIALLIKFAGQGSIAASRGPF